MRKLTILMFLVTTCFLALAQSKEKAKAKVKGKAKSEMKSAGFTTIEEAQVPEAVKSAFAAGAVGATNVRWEKHTAKGKADKSFTKYVAVYQQDGGRARARYREDGTALSSSRYMGVDKLPQNIATTAKSKNPGFELVGGEEVKTKKGDKLYRVRMKKGSSKLTTLYDANGNEVTKDKQSEEVQEDEGDSGN